MNSSALIFQDKISNSENIFPMTETQVWLIKFDKYIIKISKHH